MASVCALFATGLQLFVQISLAPKAILVCRPIFRLFLAEWPDKANQPLRREKKLLVASHIRQANYYEIILINMI